MLELRDLHVKFNDSPIKEAVAGISLCIPDGAAVALVGESGSGKTVTAMTISGLIDRKRVTCRGAVLLDDRDLLQCTRTELRELQGSVMGVVFQEPMHAMNPLLRIGVQVEEALRVHQREMSRQERRERALAALRDVDLPEVEKVYDSFPHECSGGMLQRAMIAAALVTSPRLLLLDEPTTALDVSVQAQILKLLQRLNREKGTTMLLISHDLRVVRQLCGQVAVMQRGKIVETGTVEDIFAHAQHPYTRELLDAIPTRQRRTDGRIGT